MSEPPSVCLFTPTWKGHLPHFLLQRESIERTRTTFPHVAVVNHEDVPLFRDQPFQRDLTIVSTRELLPRSIERRRLARFRRFRDPRRHLSKHLHGWVVQQYLKLSAPAVVSATCIVCLDSDTVFLDRVTAADFTDPATGRPLIYETTDDVDLEMVEWLARATRFLGHKTAHRPISRFTHSPVIMHRELLVELVALIEKQHRCDWRTAMERFGLIMEYSLYGAYAKFVDNLARVVPAKPSLTLYYWWADEVAQVAATLADRVRTSEARILAIQCNTGIQVETYRPILEQLWSERSAAAGKPE